MTKPFGLMSQLVIVCAMLLIGGCAAANSSAAVETATGRVTALPQQVNLTGDAEAHASATSAEEAMIKSEPAAKLDKSPFTRAAPLSSNLWINSKPRALSDLRGRVVVVEFWTFACYNCKNTLPFVKDWYKKYREQGLVVIGVHTPELSFEKDVDNVKQAVKEYGIEYPVAIDGDYGNWNRYNVWAWPTWFIIDKEGYIRYQHVGEGDYAGSEKTIQQLLAE